MPGLNAIESANRQRILSGIQAVTALQALRLNPSDPSSSRIFKQHVKDLGFGLLLRKYTDDVAKATPDQIQAAAEDTIPPVLPLFFSFRLMVVLGFGFFILFSWALYSGVRSRILQSRWLLWSALLAIPLPYLSAELGWFVAEVGRQPWTIYGVLPTTLSVSTLSAGEVWGSLLTFVGFYTGLLIVEMYLMIHYARLGPVSINEQRYAQSGEIHHA